MLDRPGLWSGSPSNGPLPRGLWSGSPPSVLLLRGPRLAVGAGAGAQQPERRSGRRVVVAFPLRAPPAAHPTSPSEETQVAPARDATTLAAVALPAKPPRYLPADRVRARGDPRSPGAGLW